MKTKLLLWSAILFFALGVIAKDSGLFYFFSIHLFMLFIGRFFHKLTVRRQVPENDDPLPEIAESVQD